MTISEKVAYLKGLADGLDLQEKPSKEGKLIAKIIDILEDVGFAVEDLEVEVEALTDEVESVAEDLSDVETMVFEDWEDEDDEDACGHQPQPAPAGHRAASALTGPSARRSQSSRTARTIKPKRKIAAASQRSRNAASKREMPPKLHARSSS